MTQGKEAKSGKVKLGGMFIDDDEIRERVGDDFAQVIADLDAVHKTQKGMATWPAEARSRVNVEAYLKQRADQAR